MKNHKAKPGNGTGLVIVDASKLQVALIRRGLSETDFCVATGVSPKTMASIRHGGGVRPSTLKQIAESLEMDPVDLLARGQIAADGRLSEWTTIEPVSEWHAASNGLEFRIWKLQHQNLADTFGRGKCYKVQRLSDREKKRLTDVLLRHAQVCRKFRGSPHIPINLNVFAEQDGQTWWAVDEWIEGHSVQEMLQVGPLLRDDLANVMTQVAEGLKALHQAVIVRRDLAPWNILVRVADRMVVLTDFEMSKLFDGSPTVAGKWLENPYRAPEICAEVPADGRADLYSWARVLVHAATGELPQHGQEKAALDAAALPATVRGIVERCLAPLDLRPRTIDEVLAALESWHAVAVK